MTYVQVNIWGKVIQWKCRLNPANIQKILCYHCVKSIHIRSYSGPHFYRIWTEYGEILRISPYSIQIKCEENADHNNSEYGHILRSVQPLSCDFLEHFSSDLSFLSTSRSCHQRCSIQKAALEIFAIFTWKHLCCKNSENFKNT